VGFAGKDNQLITASRRREEVDRLTFRDTRGKDGRPTRVFPIRPVGATALAVRPDGRFAAVGQGSGSITLYDLTGDQPPRTVGISSSCPTARANGPCTTWRAGPNDAPAAC
jgi:hypothetical protein